MAASRASTSTTIPATASTERAPPDEGAAVSTSCSTCVFMLLEFVVTWRILMDSGSTRLDRRARVAHRESRTARHDLRKTRTVLNRSRFATAYGACAGLYLLRSRLCRMSSGCWRLGSESNRRRRLCRPLHDHSAT